MDISKLVPPSLPPPSRFPPPLPEVPPPLPAGLPPLSQSDSISPSSAQPSFQLLQTPATALLTTPTTNAADSSVTTNEALASLGVSQNLAALLGGTPQESSEKIEQCGPGPDTAGKQLPLPGQGSALDMLDALDNEDLDKPWLHGVADLDPEPAAFIPVDNDEEKQKADEVVSSVGGDVASSSAGVAGSSTDGGNAKVVEKTEEELWEEEKLRRKKYWQEHPKIDWKHLIPPDDMYDDEGVWSDNLCKTSIPGVGENAFETIGKDLCNLDDKADLSGVTDFDHFSVAGGKGADSKCRIDVSF